MPTELLVEIFGYLHPDTGLDSRASASTLNALTQTCRLLHPIATQTLYERYHPLFHAPCQKYMWRLASDPLVRSCIKHIKVESGELDDVDEWRPASEIRANFEQLGALQQYEFANDTLEKELTLLVLQAPNLESYIHHTLEECIDPVVTKVTPSWLRPFLDIGRQVHQGILPIQKYRNLHTVKINTQLMFDTELAYLFALPSLRRLRIILASCKGQDEAALRWPIAIAGTSGVHTLQLDEISLPADVVAQMIMCCRKLVVFECFGVSNEFEDPSSWCQKVVSALEYHGGSLTRLCLDPQPRAFMKNTGEDYKRVDGFHLLTALESLWTPFHILMGRPVGATDQLHILVTIAFVKQPIDERDAFAMIATKPLTPKLQAIHDLAGQMCLQIYRSPHGDDRPI
ncbi:hypothetical protein CC86DRAFT_464400 [Ophiobolus disseminans]|uniref:F-box domain-containing protein n=1 Tax=Ophiobolus disseminans TaxID=1469910 RepID=A0A6A7A9M2_9PLEO|nr:hypothetical protein CC86DRAFT_464400 [Ophiobolus disseminans]